MKFDITVPKITPSANGCAVKAYADVRLDSEAGSVVLHGCSVIDSDGKPPWVGFPQKPGKNANKYFPVIEIEGDLKGLIVKAILDAYTAMK